MQKGRRVKKNLTERNPEKKMILLDQRVRKGGLKDLPKEKMMFVGTAAKQVADLVNAVQKRKRRRSIFLTWMKKLRVSFLPS